MMKHVTCYAPKWGKYRTNWGQISKASQHRQVTYQITHLATLIQKKNNKI